MRNGTCWLFYTIVILTERYFSIFAKFITDVYGKMDRFVPEANLKIYKVHLLF